MSHQTLAQEFSSIFRNQVGVLFQSIALKDF